MDPIRYEDFDMIGLFSLKPSEVEGIEKFVTPYTTKDGKTMYLSRSAVFNQDGLTYTDRCLQRGELSSSLLGAYGKRALVIVENMLNNSARVYFSEMQKQIFEGSSNLEQVRKCLHEDVRNALRVLRGEEPEMTYHVLPTGEDITEGRHIECSNLAILDLFARSLTIRKPENTVVINPGLGSVLIGPFLHETAGINYQNVYLSLYANSQNPSIIADIYGKDSKTSLKQALKDGSVSVKELITDPSVFSDRKNNFLIIDDNMGTGETLRILRRAITEETGKPCYAFGVQTNYVNYARVVASYAEKDKYTYTGKFDYDNQIAFIKDNLSHNSDAHKLTRPDLTTFNPDDKLISLSPINFADYHLIKDCIAALKEGNAGTYFEILGKYGYGNTVRNDLGVLKDTAETIMGYYKGLSPKVPGVTTTYTDAIQTPEEIIVPTNEDIQEEGDQAPNEDPLVDTVDEFSSRISYVADQLAKSRFDNPTE